MVVISYISPRAMARMKALLPDVCVSEKNLHFFISSFTESGLH